PYKNQITLIKAMKEILKKNHRVHLYIIGEEFDKECKREMLEVIKENNLEKYITFTGFETDIRSYLEKCDIYVQPSFNEGLGRSIIEAYLFSIPTIGSDIPGIRSIVKNDFNGLLFDPSNHIELSQKILTLIENDKMRTNFGKQGRQFVCQHFNLEENSKKIEEYIIE
ncbi:glycosyltransferase family 4 protein, partial [Priestia filamentosa]|uniref:glycosyltransferase family 4 protein n=1 Tax=Priestia filamentosa TaxID=1402861 RepID=UPI0039833D26